MPSTIKCPVCGVALEVPDEHLGGEVKCKECGFVFEATARTPAPAPAPAGPRRRPRLDDDDDDDDDDDRPARRSRGGRGNCEECGAALGPRDRYCPDCDAPVGRAGPRDLQEASSKKLSAGLCGILIGGLGVHKFILGYSNAGIAMLLVTILGGIVTCGAAWAVMHVIGFIEGIIYLTKSDEQFYDTYIRGRKEWF